jgi:hypothetical protein
MRIAPKVHEQAVSACRRYSRLKGAFGRFYVGGQLLTEQRSRLENFVFEPSLENNRFDVLLMGMRLQFLFAPLYDENGALHGNVFCSRCHPRFSENPLLIESFKFDAQGITDFEVDEGQDRLEIEYNAPEIILHFITQALAMPLQ